MIIVYPSVPVNPEKVLKQILCFVRFSVTIYCGSDQIREVTDP